MVEKLAHVGHCEEGKEGGFVYMKDLHEARRDPQSRVGVFLQELGLKFGEDGEVCLLCSLLNFSNLDRVSRRSCSIHIAGC